MDTQTLLIIIVSSLVFIGVVLWKIIWIMKKIHSSEAPETTKSKD